jgi:hypothetical protein
MSRFVLMPVLNKINFQQLPLFKVRKFWQIFKIKLILYYLLAKLKVYRPQQNLALDEGHDPMAWNTSL